MLDAPIKPLRFDIYYSSQSYFIYSFLEASESK